MKNDFQFEIDFCKSILAHSENETTAMEMLAGFYTKAGRIDEGLELDRKIVEIEPENAVGHYNLACSLALKKRADEAIDALRTAFEKGYRDFSWIMEDPDLNNLHENPAFSALISEYKIQQ